MVLAETQPGEYGYGRYAPAPFPIKMFNCRLFEIDSEATIDIFVVFRSDLVKIKKDLYMYVIHTSIIIVNGMELR